MSKNSYEKIISHIFSKYYTNGISEIPFARDEIEDAAEFLGLSRPKNVGDVIYSFRYRNSMPPVIESCAPAGKHWVIRGDGRARYKFCLSTISRVTPSENLIITKIPDATPELIRENALGDEQAILALVRYNRLIDTFLGVTAYSLQNHLRTTVSKLGQVEVDEVYVAVDRFGVQYILPTQAKGGNDEIGIVQIEQDIAMCQAKFPHLVVRPIAAQFMGSVIALFELAIQDEEIVVVRESHYELVPYDQISESDRDLFKKAAGLPLTG